MTRDLVIARWFEPLIEPKAGMKAVWAIIIVLLVITVGWLVYTTGGTTFVWAHSIYVPILLAAAVFRVPGALLTALSAGLMLGPWMPLDVAAGTPQSTLNWIYRMAFLSVIGTFAGILFTILGLQLSRLRRLAFEDIETHLPNRLSLEVDARDAMTLSKDERRVHLVSIRLVRFEEMTAALGLWLGRKIVRILGDHLQQLVGTRGTLYRLDSDSFAILMQDCTLAQCKSVARDVIDLIESPHQVDGVPVHLDALFGIASFPLHERDDAEMLIRKSVLALQMAESSGKRWSSYDSQRDSAQQESMALLGELKPSIEDGQLELFYQPKVSLADWQVVGFEALVRWRHPQRGMVPPNQFIPAAEQSGLIHPLTDWVMEAALEQLSRWEREGLRTSVAVNVSGRNLRDERFVPRLHDLVQAFNPPEGTFELELTENSIFSDEASVLRQLEEVRRMGIALSIDDFGTGYSSLSYLQRLPLSTLKIDRSFIIKMENADNASSKIVQTSILLAQNLCMKTVAEGVENLNVLQELREMGCDAFQGYYCARPLPANEATAWLRQHITEGWHPH